MEFDIPYKNHAIKINQQSNLLLDMINRGVEAGVNSIEAKRNIENLRNLAVRYSDAVLKNQELVILVPIFNDMMKHYNLIARNFVDKNYKPMRLVRESLMYLLNTNSTISNQIQEQPLV